MPNIETLQDYRRFVIGRYIGPVLAIRSLQYMYVSNGKLLEKSKWVEFNDTEENEGFVRVNKNFNSLNFPGMKETFSLEQGKWIL